MQPADLQVEGEAARISGDLTFSTVAGLYARMMTNARSGSMPRSIDLSGVRRIDSAGLALLLEWQSAFRKQSGNQAASPDHLEIRNPPDALLKIARLCEAEEYLSDGSRLERRKAGEAG